MKDSDSSDRHPRLIIQILFTIIIMLYTGSMLWSSALPSPFHTPVADTINVNNVSIGKKLGHPDWIEDYIRFHNSPDTSETKYLVWTCTAAVQCGGIGDRARGIVGSFYLALATRRKLLIVNPDPVDLSEVVRPAAIDWANGAVDIDNGATFDIDSMGIIHADVYRIPTPELRDQKTIRIRTNTFLFGLTVMNDRAFAQNLESLKVPHGNWTEAVGSEILFNWAWNALMVPTDALRSDIESLKRQVGLGSTPFNLVHIRTGSHWSDGGRHGSEGDFHKFLDCLDTVSGIVGDYQVYVASDDVDTKKRFVQMSSHRVVFDNMSDPFHVDRSSKNDHDALSRNLRAWTEFYLVTMAVCPVISLSGYSMWPVIMSRDPETGARCFARFDLCDAQRVHRSQHELVSVRGLDT